jgi:hypothetical protein
MLSIWKVDGDLIARMRVPKMVKNGFNSVLQTSRVREGWLPQGIQEQTRSPKLSPNHKRRIKIILDQFRNKHARWHNVFEIRVRKQVS